jgi:hypothetical protein
MYTLEELENARTHDDLWNAAQIQMTRDGKMHVSTVYLVVNLVVVIMKPDDCQLSSRLSTTSVSQDIDWNDLHTYSYVYRVHKHPIYSHIRTPVPCSLTTPYIHTIQGFLRMYWAKKILEWTPSPEEALRISIFLNDKYELDGRDPNGYVGCMWSIGGIHDQGWGERAIFGKIRFMNYQVRTYIYILITPSVTVTKTVL